VPLPSPAMTLSSRLQTSLVLGGILFVAVTLTAMFLWMSWYTRRVVIADTYVSSSNLALSVDQFIARTIETIDLSLRVSVEEIGVDAAHNPEKVDALLAERVRQFSQITSLTILGPDGAVRFSSTRLPKHSPSLAERNFFTLARESTGIRFAVEEPTLSHVGSKHVIVAGRRFNGPKGHFAGVVLATVNSDYIMRFFYTLNIGEQGLIALETSDGTLLLRRPYVDDYIGRNFSSGVLFQGMLPWASSGVFPMQYQTDGQWRIVGYQRVERLPLVVEVALSQDEALANWWYTSRVQAAAGGAIVIIIGTMAFWLNRELRARLLAHGHLRKTVRQLERARLRAEESNRVKSQFMANMSHELRTPLNAIIGFSEVIRDALVGPVSPRYRDYARDIQGSGKHLLGLINDVLDLSKIELGRLELHEEPVDLAKVAHDCHRLIADRITSGGLDFALEAPAGLPAVLGDELRLKQIILNLLSNSVKFTPAGGRIVLAISAPPDGTVVIAVADTGIGMKPEEIPIALEPFRQIDSALNRRYEGTGLGLPLARTLVELHGGFLNVISAAGRGTTVTVTLPADRVLWTTDIAQISGPKTPAIFRA
jgi:two-component system, cell cycle sensor histidine kinase PleC